MSLHLPIERLARLCPTSVRFSAEAPGGFALFSQLDYAAALGFVKNPTGADLVEYLIGSGNELTAERCRRWLAAEHYKEWDRQTREVQKRALELRIAEDGLAAKRNVTSDDRRIVAQAHSDHVRAKQASWPNDSEVMNALRRTVLDEFRDPHKCACCDGRQEFRLDELVVKCSACDGTGKQYPSDASRAAAIKRDRSTFLRNWRPVYNWSLALVEETASTAAREFLEALG